MISSMALGRAQASAVSGFLDAPSSFKNATVQRLQEVCNGCGAANAKFDFIPDRIYGTSIREACIIHDWDYEVGVTNEDKEEADRRFRNNLLRIIHRACKEKWYKPKFLMRIRAKEYYAGVKHFGGPAFWDGKAA